MVLVRFSTIFLRISIFLTFGVFVFGEESPLQVDVTKAVKCPDQEKAAKSDKVIFFGRFLLCFWANFARFWHVLGQFSLGNFFGLFVSSFWADLDCILVIFGMF
jgi:hypothetical protein